MKYGVIDIGSNSVRLMVSSGVKAQYKILKNTRLAEGLGEDKTLKENSMERTSIAIKEFHMLEAKSGRFPMPENTLHTYEDIEDTRDVLH